MQAHAVRIPLGNQFLDADFVVPPNVTGLVLFAHGSGSSRFSSRNRYVASVLQQAGLGTLLLDLLTPEEEVLDERTRELRFDIPLLAQRLVAAIDWLQGQPETTGLSVGLFGASTGGGAALVAAAARPKSVRAVVSRGGRPDLAGPALSQVRAPTLLLVGGLDDIVIRLNREAQNRMRCPVELVLIPGATHLFEEPGTLEQVAERARAWFLQQGLGSGTQQHDPYK